MFNANEAKPAAPLLNSATLAVDGTSVALAFADQSATEYKFSARRAPVSLGGIVGAPEEVATELANGNAAVDTTLAANNFYSYTVAAVGAAGESVSNAMQVSTYVVPAAPALAAATNNVDTTVALTWTIPVGMAVTGYSIVRTDGAGVVSTFTAPAAALSYNDSATAVNTTYSYVITAINGDKQTASNTVTATTPNLFLAAPDTLSTNANLLRVRVSWQDRSVGETRFSVQRSANGGAWVTLGTVNSTSQVAATGNNYQYDNFVVGANSVAAGNTYDYRVVAEKVVAGNVVLSSDPSATKTVAYKVAAAVTNLAAPTVIRNSATSTTERVSFTWTADTTVGALPITSMQVQWATNSGFTTGVGQSNLGTLTATSGVAGSVPRGAPTAKYFRVRAVNALGNGAWSTPGIGPIAMP
jgi:hypothetical protein